MNKTYNRINWKDAPDTSTPISASNLNKMDYALNEIDNRVVELAEYQEEAKESETNAKTSETNAKESETLAKEYMEKAFTYTPEGYEELVEDVWNSEIQTSTNTTLLGTKAGGLKFNHISGTSIQNGTPTPDSPIAIRHAFDCVEMIQGGYSSSNGVWGANDGYVCSKNMIHCTSGDIVKVIVGGTTDGVMLTYYNENGFVSYGWIVGTSTEYSFTIPSGVTKFALNVRNVGGITPDTVGKITLTINGKYVGCVKSHGKNLFDVNKATEKFISSSLEISNIKGYMVSEIFPIGQYVASWVTTQTYVYLVYYDENKTIKRRVVTLSSDGSAKVQAREGEYYFSFMYVIDGTSNVQIEKGTVATDYEPYTETTAYFYTDYPMMKGSTLFKEDGLFKVEHGKIEYVFNNTSNWATSSAIVGRYGVGTQEKPNGECLCNMAVNVSNSTDVGTCFNNNLGNFYINTSFKTLDEWKAYLDGKEVVVCMDRATPYIEVLDTASQLALNSLETFDGVTYIEFDSTIEPSFEVEYGTSKVGAYTLKALLNSESNAIRYNELAVALVATGSEV